MSERFRIPKTSAQAEIHLAGGEKMPAVFFLGDRAQGHEGPEHINDLLSSDIAFIPIRDPRNNEVSLVRREAIVAVAVPAGAAPEGLAELEGLPEGPVTTIVIEVTTAGSGRFRGTLRYLMPEGRRRVQDYLNTPDRIVILEQGATLLLVSKQHINGITLHSSD